jgi:uncharacterized protein involved in exopolysaccharide biosynthesis
MSTLRFDHQRSSTLRLERSDLRAHYEHVVADTLSSIRRGWRLIASLVVLALVLACVLISLLPRQYSATALVYPNLFSGEQAKIAPLGSVDAASLVASEVRLVLSDAILRAVVRRLGLHLDAATAGSSSWVSADRLRAIFLPETHNHSPFDRQVALLRKKVEVTKDTRSYLIAISLTARSADEAARIVNSIALEYLRTKVTQRRQDAVMEAEAELGRHLATYGEKHPKVLQVLDGLASARAALKAVTTPGDDAQDAIVTEESVELAIPNRTPTSPRGIVILASSFLLSLLIGIGIAVWRDRSGFELRRHGWNFKSNNTAG